MVMMITMIITYISRTFLPVVYQVLIDQTFTIAGDNGHLPSLINDNNRQPLH